MVIGRMPISRNTVVSFQREIEGFFVGVGDNEISSWKNGSSPYPGFVF
jgi:hypothetical protein